jgi:hypothetical protein
MPVSSSLLRFLQSFLPTSRPRGHLDAIQRSLVARYGLGVRVEVTQRFRVGGTTVRLEEREPVAIRDGDRLRAPRWAFRMAAMGSIGAAHRHQDGALAVAQGDAGHDSAKDAVGVQRAVGAVQAQQDRGA